MAPAPKHSPQEQEDIILKAAQKCISESSVIDFTMSAIAKEAQLSMGSIYKHVQCKEDMLFALATKLYQHHTKLFQRIMDLPISTPEKIIGINLMCPSKTRLYDFDSQLEALVHSEAVIKRASPNWAERMIARGEACEALFNGCMTQAAINGEFMVEGDTQEAVREINLGCWALTIGYQQVQRVIQLRQIVDQTDSLMEAISPDDMIIKNMIRLINSHPWAKPLDQQGVLKVCDLLQEIGFR